MSKEYFVDKNSIVREIWGKSDTILFIFAGAAAEFAINKSVDWLYFTGRLPKDPIRRLFSTVSYARDIVFSENEKALRTIDAIVSIHAAVEGSRGMKIPDWAYRDVLFMLIDYSIRSYEMLERKLTVAEKNEIFRVFHKLGSKMEISGLPQTFNEWIIMRDKQLSENLKLSLYTTDLFAQYRKHLGAVRYWILQEVQGLIVPDSVREGLELKKNSILYPLIRIYRIISSVKIVSGVKTLFIPMEFKKEVQALDVTV